MTIAATHFLALRQSPLMAGVPDAAIEALFQAGQLERCPDGCVLFEAGSAGELAYFIVDGAVEISVPDGDGQYVLRRVQTRGELLGEMALFTHGRRSARATARGAAQLLSISRTTLLMLFENWPQFAWALLGTISARLQALECQQGLKGA